MPRVSAFLGDANFLPGTAQGERAVCELGTLPLMEARDGEVEIMIRPEDVLLEANDAGPGEILERTYFGHDQLLSIRMNSGTLLRSRLVGCCRGLHEGQRVTLRVETPVMAYTSRYGCPLLPSSSSQ